MLKLVGLFFIALTLGVSPMSSYAAKKDACAGSSNKIRASHNKSSAKKSSGYKLIKYKSSAKASHRKVNMHVRSQKSDMVYMPSYDESSPLQLASSKVLVINQLTGKTVYGKNASQATPIASLTKLMTAMVLLDAHLAMDDVLFIADEDVDYLKGTHSRLTVGTQLTRGEFLQLALMSSENRAAASLARNYPGGSAAFILAMNNKAQSLGMTSTRFYDATGLDSNNVSTAEDLAKMVNAAYRYAQIRQITTTESQEVRLYGHNNPLHFVNTNALVSSSAWMIGLSKTGFTNEAGRCLVMQAEISGQPMIIVLLDSVSKQSRISDANKVRKWIEYQDVESLGEKISG